MKFPCLSVQSGLQHVFKMSAISTYACSELCTPLAANVCFDCALFGAVPNAYLRN